MPTSANVARGNSIHSSLGTVAPINTPTRRFYGKQEQEIVREPGVPNPNVYVVQPFKNASIPKDFIYTKRNAPNPAENLLNSTVELINHFTTCYEAVKGQLQEEHVKERENLLLSRTMTVSGRANTLSRNTSQRPAKQARLRPLIPDPNRNGYQGPTIDDCVGILPVPGTKTDDLIRMYDEKLRVLRRLKPDLFDVQGNLQSLNDRKSNSYSQVSAPSTKNRSAIMSYRTPHNTLLTAENIPYDERRTFLTEFNNDKEEDEETTKSASIASTQHSNLLIDHRATNYVLKVVDIKKVIKSATKREQTKSASEK